MEDTLRQVVKKMARNELEKLKNEKNPEMHKMFISEMERGLLPVVMDQTDENQSKAAQWLGINRGTFRKRWKALLDINQEIICNSPGTPKSGQEIDHLRH